MSEIVHPTFSLSRGEGCEIHKNAFLELQTYLGLRENLAANEGARGFLYESNRKRTPLGQAVHTNRASPDTISRVETIHMEFLA